MMSLRSILRNVKASESAEDDRWLQELASNDEDMVAALDKTAREVQFKPQQTLLEQGRNQVKSVLENLEERKTRLTDDIARLNEELRQTNVSIQAFKAADQVFNADAVKYQKPVNTPDLADAERQARIRTAS